VLCSCRTGDVLCGLCREGLFTQLRGSAALRGERYADELAAARVVPRDTPWPTGSPKLMAVARLRCADLSRDVKLLELLAAEFLVWAGRRWTATSGPSRD
jgi:hypothetical protein